MTPAARLSAAIEILDHILAGQNAEAALTAWGRASRFAGAGDRRALRDLVFDALRCKRSFGALGGAVTGRGLILGGLRAGGMDEGQIASLFCGQGHAPSPLGPADTARAALHDEALDMPNWLVEEMAQSVPDLPAVAAALRQRAPVFLRVNRAKASAAEVQAELATAGVITQLIDELQNALQVTANAHKIASLPALLEGRVELQDASSQAVIAALDVPKSGRILDFCAGGGGKILAIAAQVHENNAIKLFAHDANPRRMADLLARAARAGAQITLLDALPDLSKFNSQSDGYDLILTDVPCSGSGSWRRDPQGKWAITPEKLRDVAALQGEIMDQAAAILAPAGVLAYSTCSVLRRENEDQVAAFLQRNPTFECRLMRRFGLADLPRDMLGGDGFFLAVLSQTKRG